MERDFVPVAEHSRGLGNLEVDRNRQSVPQLFEERVVGGKAIANLFDTGTVIERHGELFRANLLAHRTEEFDDDVHGRGRLARAAFVQVDHLPSPLPRPQEARTRPEVPPGTRTAFARKTGADPQDGRAANWGGSR